MRLKDRMVIGGFYAASIGLACVITWGFTTGNLQYTYTAFGLEWILVIPGFWDAVASRIRRKEDGK